MNAHLGRVVAAEDGTVLHERDANPRPSRGNRRAAAGHAAADHHKIKVARLVRLASAHVERACRRRFVSLCKNNARTAAVKPRQVAKRDVRRPRLDLDRTAVLPGPGTFARTENVLQRRTVDKQGELAGRTFCPVLRPDEDAPYAGLGEYDPGGRVRHRTSHAMRNQVRRADDVHQSRIQSPSASLERLRENLDTRSASRQHARQHADRHQSSFNSHIGKLYSIHPQDASVHDFVNHRRVS